MFRFRSSWSLPLLAKELLEQSARFRTYAVRMSFVFAMCAISLLVLEEHSNALNPLALLGSGDTILKSLVYVQFGGIYLLLPATACGAFTIEKERNTLGLLFLTRLGPWTIVFEKLTSRLLPMACLLLCSLPVYALANALGGITRTDLFCAIWFVSLAAFQVACVAVMCSAFAHSTTAAFLQTYVVILAFTFGLALIDTMRHVESLASFFSFCMQSLSKPLSTMDRTGEPTRFYFPFSPPHLYMVIRNTDPTAFPAGGPVVVSIATSINTFVWSLACLGVARFCLYRRAAAKWWNPLTALIRLFDRATPRADLVGDKIRGSHPKVEALPETQPVGWRETSRGLLGTKRGMISIVTLLELPVIGLASFLVLNDLHGSVDHHLFSASTLVLALWAVMFFVTLAATTGIFPRERNQQTLDVLLTTPIRGDELVLQKLQRIGRMQMVCAVPLLTAILVEVIWRQVAVSIVDARPPSYVPYLKDANLIDGFCWWEYLFGAVTSVWLFSQAFMWIALWHSLMFRSAMRALVSAMAVTIVYCGLPFAILFWIEFHERWLFSYEAPIKWIFVVIISCSPVLSLLMNEGIGRIRFVSQYPMVLAIGSLIVQGSLVLMLRWHILKHAEWYLGRGPYRQQFGDPPPVDDASHEPLSSPMNVSKSTGNQQRESMIQQAEC